MGVLAPSSVLPRASSYLAMFGTMSALKNILSVHFTGRNPNMTKYLITFKRKAGRVTHLVEMPSMPKLLAWIEKNGAGCDTVLIQRVEDKT